ncbi:phosphatase PAP2 family protein [Labrenzia sp. VG12]|uniref:phosphatase PAP2 family protein n=1 Tax=Labrenzia sp. VG12 TaxID=2021862 RepID=UPI0012FD96AD|nr:phosphatase PAP2 family protein [Labrenzia sp. VG12]
MQALSSPPTLWQLVRAGLLSFPVLLAIASGALITLALSRAGWDATANEVARLQDPTFSLFWSAPAMLAGLAVPFLVPAACAVSTEMRLAKATLAAFLASLIAVSLLKGFTSRLHPEALIPHSVLARSLQFEFGFLRNGVLSLIEGWPSGHMATNTAVAIVLAKLTPNIWIARLCWVWIGWIALATVFGISGDVHWLSDMLAGALLGSAIAFQVLRGFRSLPPASHQR